MASVPSAEYPPYVLTQENRDRWDICSALARRQDELLSATPDARYVWMMTRWLYRSDVPTGTQADQDAAAKMADERRTAAG